jgi:hypothetical protein
MKRYVIVQPEFAYFRDGNDLIPLTPPNDGFLFLSCVVEIPMNAKLTEEIMCRFLRLRQIPVYDDMDGEEWKLC